MIRRPPRSTLDRSSAASDVYKRQDVLRAVEQIQQQQKRFFALVGGQRQHVVYLGVRVGANFQHDALVTAILSKLAEFGFIGRLDGDTAVSYTHLRAHETVLDIVCRLLLEKTTITSKHNLYS